MTTVKKEASQKKRTDATLFLKLISYRFASKTENTKEDFPVWTHSHSATVHSVRYPLPTGRWPRLRPPSPFTLHPHPPRHPLLDFLRGGEVESERCDAQRPARALCLFLPAAAGGGRGGECFSERRPAAGGRRPAVGEGGRERGDGATSASGRGREGGRAGGRAGGAEGAAAPARGGGAGAASSFDDEETESCDGRRHRPATPRCSGKRCSGKVRFVDRRTRVARLRCRPALPLLPSPRISGRMCYFRDPILVFSIPEHSWLPFPYYL